MAPGFTIDDRLGTFHAVAALAPEHGATLDAISAAVAERHPDAVEAASVRERSVSWGYATSRRNWYAYAMPHKAHVSLGFFQGIHLPDPETLLEGSGKVLRDVKLRTPDDLRRPAVLSLLEAVRNRRVRALNPTERS